MSPPRKQASQELTREGDGYQASFQPIALACTGSRELLQAVAGNPALPRRLQLQPPALSCPSPAHLGKEGEGRRATPPNPATYFRAPTAFCAAVTTDENPGPLEESLLLPIPSSLSMNTQRHPRSRSSHSGGSRSSRATSGAGSRCSGGAGYSAPLPLAFPQLSVDRPLTSAPKKLSTLDG